jgi:hypothetical protein
MPVATGYLLYEIMFFQCHKGIQRNIAMSLCLLLFAIISISAIKGHLAHAQLSYLFAYRTKSIQEVWNNTPPDSIVFSDVLFRKSAYPMIYGYGMDISKYPQSIQEKMPPLVLSLEKQHVEYILIANPDAYNFLDPTFSSYVNKNFEKIPGKDIYRRKKTG